MNLANEKNVLLMHSSNGWKLNMEEQLKHGFSQHQLWHGCALQCSNLQVICVTEKHWYAYIWHGLCINKSRKFKGKTGCTSPAYDQLRLEKAAKNRNYSLLAEVPDVARVVLSAKRMCPCDPLNVIIIYSFLRVFRNGQTQVYVGKKSASIKSENDEIRGLNNGTAGKHRSGVRSHIEQSHSGRSWRIWSRGFLYYWRNIVYWLSTKWRNLIQLISQLISIFSNAC